ncbi:MAG: hypothetical protein ACJATT_000577 [Myxococcota bacterium]|jgi:hypothetical protein
MAKERTVSQDSIGPVVKALDVGIGALKALGVERTRLTEDAILGRAMRETGLSDFGDSRFRIPMRRILGMIEKRNGLNNMASVTFNHAMTQAAANRLRLVAYQKAHPDVHDVKVERPVFVLGFPRTGTTALQNLLASDPRRRGLEFWEICNPLPSGASSSADDKRRVRKTKRDLDIAYRVAPEMEVVHWIDAHTIEECWPLFANSFSVMNWDLQTGISEWGDFLSNDWDMRWAYGEYKQYLQALLHQRPTQNLVLKCPEHLWFLDELLETFPDAAIVWSHRDPYKSIASYCSLISLQWRTLYGKIDTKGLGAHITKRFHQGVEAAMDARSRANPKQFFDVRFSKFIQDPAAMVSRILTHFDLPNDTLTEAGMNAWMNNKRADARGKHQYDPDHYGLDASKIRGRYQSYIDNFDVSTRAA